MTDARPTRHALDVLAMAVGVVGVMLATASTVMVQPTPAQPSAAPPDLVVTNARIWTGDPARPWAEALAASGERLVAVGTAEEIRARPGAAGARAIDARGRLVTPGFIDAHVHIIEGGFRLASVQLRDAATRELFVERIAAFARTVPPGTWITGGDWDHELWGGALPERSWIDAVTPEHPVWINRLDGHMALANGVALTLAGVTRAVGEVPGGAIERTASGELTGLLRDNAMALVDKAVPPPSEAMADRALEAAMDYVAARGVTSAHHMGDWADLATFERAHRRGALRTRIYAAVQLPTWERLAERERQPPDGRPRFGDAWLRTGLLKGFVDGSLGSQTAAFHEPFTSAPGDRGLFVNEPDALYAWIAGADKAGLHVAVHAIGDRANAVLLDIYARVAREHGPRDRRFRIEHAQHLAARDVPRFAPLGVIASMQPYHAIDDGRWAERVIGAERSKTTYAFRSLLDAKADVAFGSDWFVAPPTPLEGIYAAVTRRTLDGRHAGGWVPEQRIAVEEALRAYTTAGAYASFEEGLKGTLAPGRLADFVVLERDLFTVAPEAIGDIAIDLTVVGGRVVFERKP
jgi:predicted amidohydrolase YtcJ